MSVLAHARRAQKEAALVLRAEVEGDLKAIRTIHGRLSESTHYITAQQTVYQNKLAGLLLHIFPMFIYLSKSVG